MAKRFIRKLSLILVAALLIASCPLSTLAIDEAEMIELSQVEAEQEGSVTDEIADGEAITGEVMGETGEIIESEGTQDLSEETGMETESVVVAETGIESAVETSSAEGESGPTAGPDAVAESMAETVAESQSAESSSATGPAFENVIKIDDETTEKTTDESNTAASPSNLPPVEFVSEAVDGVIVTVTAPEGVFPEKSKLVVNKVAENNSDLSEIEAAVDNAKLIEDAQGKSIDDTNAETKTERYTFDIKVVGEDGKEIQPTADVQVKFALADSVKPIAEANVYHLEQNSKEKTADQVRQLNAALNGETYSSEETTVEMYDYSDLDGDVADDLGETGNTKSAKHVVTEAAETDAAEVVELKESSLIAKPLEAVVDEETAQLVEVETEGFSYYVVEFFYKTYKYVLEGDGEVELNTILNTFELNIDPSAITKVEVSDDTLFVATKSEGTWYVQSLKAFSTEEWMKVYVGDVVYEVKVTDDTLTVATISSEAEFVAACTNGGEYILGNDIVISGSYKDDEIDLSETVILDLNGHSVGNAGGNETYISVDSSFSVTDTSEEGTGSFDVMISVQVESIFNITGGSVGGGIINSGTVNISDGTIAAAAAEEEEEVEVEVQNDGIININGGTVSSRIINGEKIKKTRYTGYIYINLGTISGNIDNEYGDIIIIGGYITGCITNETEYADVTISNGKFDETPVGSNHHITGGSFKYDTVRSLLTSDYEAVQNAATGYYNVQYRTDVPSAKIGNVVYQTLENALASASEGDTIKLLRNIVYSGDNGVEITKSITLDFNGHTYTGWISAGDYEAVTLSKPVSSDGPDVTLIGSSIASPIILEVVPGSTLTIESGNYSSNTFLGSSAFITVWRKNNLSGNLVINGGTFNGRICSYGNVVYNNGEMTGGIDHYSAYANTIINGGHFTGTYGYGAMNDVALILSHGGTMVVNSGTIDGSIITLAGATAELYDITVRGSVVAFLNTRIDVYGGTYDTTIYNNIYAEESATLALHGGLYHEPLPYGDDTTFKHIGYVAKNEGLTVTRVSPYWWLIGPQEDPEAALLHGSTEETGTLLLMLAKAESGDRVRLLKDLPDKASETHTVKSGVTLDLDGFALYDHSLIALTGTLQDSMSRNGTVAQADRGPNSMGWVKSEALFSVNSLNPSLPLYDISTASQLTQAGAYRLFEYTFNTNFGPNGQADYLKCQYKITFRNAANKAYAYQLMASGNSKVAMKGYIAWHNKDGNEVATELAFTNAHISAYGQAYVAYPSKSTVFFVKLSRISTLQQHNRIIKTYPTLTVNGVTGEFAYTGSGSVGTTKYARLATAGAGPSDATSYAHDTEPWNVAN